MSLRRDERGIIINWLLKLLVGLAVVGVILFDVGAILVNQFTLDSAADDTAVALSLAFQPNSFGTNDVELFEQAKALVASDETLAGDAKVVRNGTQVDEQGIVYVRLRRTAKTLLVSKIEAISKWGRATAEGQASTN